MRTLLLAVMLLVVALTPAAFAVSDKVDVTIIAWNSPRSEFLVDVTIIKGAAEASPNADFRLSTDLHVQDPAGNLVGTARGEDAVAALPTLGIVRNVVTKQQSVLFDNPYRGPAIVTATSELISSDGDVIATSTLTVSLEIT